MKVIKATTNDAKTLTDLTIRSKAYWNYSQEQIELWREDLTITKDYINKNQVHILFDQEFLIGYYSFYLTDKSTVKLDNIFIDPAFIGKGYGKKLMERFIHNSREMNLEKIELISEPHAEDFYKKMGFHTVSKQESSIKNRYLPIMELKL